MQRVARIVSLVALIAAGVSTAGAAEAPRLLPPATPTTREVVYVALGDSTVEGIGASSPAHTYPSRIAARLRERYPQVRLVNLGVAGAVSDDVVARQLERAVALRPALVTLSVGPNDVTTGVAATVYARNVERILRTLQERTDAVVVVNLLPDLALTPRFARSPRAAAVGRRAEELNVILADVAKRFDTEVNDLHTQSRREVPQRPELVGADGYHPSDAGYARWAEVMWEGIARRLPPAERGNDTLPQRRVLPPQ